MGKKLDIVKRLRIPATNDHALRIALDNEAADEIDRLRVIEAAAKNLIEQKGRHNTQIAYERLEALLKTPNAGNNAPPKAVAVD